MRDRLTHSPIRFLDYPTIALAGKLFEQSELLRTRRCNAAQRNLHRW